MTVFQRLFPAQLDNRFSGQRSALWLLGAFLAVKLAMSINMIANTAAVASGADGIPLDSFGPAAAREVLLLFALVGLGQLALTCLGLVALVRYRAMVPFAFLLLLAEHAARRLIVQSYAVDRMPAASTAFAINMVLMAVLIVGLGLSLWPRRVS